MTTTRPHNGRPRMKSARLTTSGKASAWDERGRRTAVAADQAGQRAAPRSGPAPDADRGIDDDDAGTGGTASRSSMSS